MARQYTRRDWILAGVILAVVLGLGIAFQGRLAPPTSDYSVCAEAIRGASENPTAAEIPYVKTLNGLTSWPRGSGLRLQNQFGAMIDTTASCITDGRGNVTGLSISGETIF